jgi:hypothetical protein
MAPLCEYEGSMSSQNACGETRKIISACDKIPDENDREWRVVPTRGNNGAPRVIVAYTCGPDEYGEGPFYPTPGEVAVAGLGVLDVFSKAGIEVQEVRMESWRDTTFLLRDTGVAEQGVHLPSLEGVGKNVEGLKISISLSPQAINAASLSLPIEREGAEKQNAFEKVGNELATLIREAVGLPEGMAEVNIQPSLAAQTDIAVDIDFLMTGEPLSSDVRALLAAVTQSFLNANKFTRNGIATIWVRQGQPEVALITPKNRS